MDDNRDIGSRDQALFDSIWKEYVIKDVVASSKIARRHRLRQTLKKVVLQRDTHLLEVGCAGGFSVDYLEGLYRSYTGVDYSTALIGHAIQRFVRPNTRFHAVNIKEYQPDAQFDVILMIGVLHHIDDLDYVLGRLKDMLKPGGCLIANEPHPANPLISLARAIRKRIDPRYSEDQKELEIEELERLFVNAGFENIEMHPQGVLSTPFAEVVMRPQWLARPMSGMACRLDEQLEKLPARILRPFTWNVVAIGQRPG